jgi:hypothetical protein
MASNVELFPIGANADQLTLQDLIGLEFLLHQMIEYHYLQRLENNLFSKISKFIYCLQQNKKICEVYYWSSLKVV